MIWHKFIKDEFHGALNHHCCILLCIGTPGYSTLDLCNLWMCLSKQWTSSWEFKPSYRYSFIWFSVPWLIPLCIKRTTDPNKRHRRHIYTYNIYVYLQRKLYYVPATYKCHLDHKTTSFKASLWYDDKTTCIRRPLSFPKDGPTIQILLYIYTYVYLCTSTCHAFSSLMSQAPLESIFKWFGLNQGYFIQAFSTILYYKNVEAIGIF